YRWSVLLQAEDGIRDRNVTGVQTCALPISRSWLIPGIGLGLLVLSAIIIGGIWPALLQSFTVDPSEPDKEGPYIARNIEATRAAYGLSDVEKVDYSAKTDMSHKEMNESTVWSVYDQLIYLIIYLWSD